MTDKNPIVVMKGITIEFPGVKALDGVDSTLYPGEVHALMGENGAGKSTMIKARLGVLQDQRRLHYGGRQSLSSSTAPSTHKTPVSPPCIRK